MVRIIAAALLASLCAQLAVSQSVSQPQLTSTFTLQGVTAGPSGNAFLCRTSDAVTSSATSLPANIVAKLTLPADAVVSTNASTSCKNQCTSLCQEVKNSDCNVNTTAWICSSTDQKLSLW